jgi:hypothetical protein
MTSVASPRPIETRAELESLEQLHAERRTLLQTLAPLKALHGPFGLFDDRRSQFLETMKVKARRELMTETGKATDEGVKARATADPAYVQFLNRGESDRIEYIRQATSLSELEERIRSREIELMAYAAEARLGR